MVEKNIMKLRKTCYPDSVHERFIDASDKSKPKKWGNFKKYIGVLGTITRHEECWVPDNIKKAMRTKEFIEEVLYSGHIYIDDDVVAVYSEYFDIMDYLNKNWREHASEIPNIYNIMTSDRKQSDEKTDQWIDSLFSRNSSEILFSELKRHFFMLALDIVLKDMKEDEDVHVFTKNSYMYAHIVREANKNFIGNIMDHEVYGFEHDGMISVIVSGETLGKERNLRHVFLDFAPIDHAVILNYVYRDGMDHVEFINRIFKYVEEEYRYGNIGETMTEKQTKYLEDGLVTLIKYNVSDSGGKENRSNE